MVSSFHLVGEVGNFIPSIGEVHELSGNPLDRRIADRETNIQLDKPIL